MTRSDRFTWERQLRASDGVVGTRLLVLLTLATWMDADGGNAHPGHALVAEVTGLAERTVRQHLAGAVEEGWLELVRRGHRAGTVPVASCYRATIPTGARLPVGEVPSGVEPPVGPVDNGTPTGTTVPVGPVDTTTPTGTPTPQGDSQPAPPRFPTGTGAPPTTQVPPREHPPAQSTRHPAAGGGEQSKIDEVLAAWIEGQVAHTDATTGVRDPAALRRHLANRALDEHLEVARRLVTDHPDQPPGVLAAVLAGNHTIAAALASQRTGRHLRVIDGTSS